MADCLVRTSCKKDSLTPPDRLAPCLALSRFIACRPMFPRITSEMKCKPCLLAEHCRPDPEGTCLQAASPWQPVIPWRFIPNGRESLETSFTIAPDSGESTS